MNSKEENEVYILLFNRIYTILIETIRKHHPTIKKEFLIACISSSSIYSRFERLSSSVVAVVQSAVLKSGLKDLSDEFADDIISFIKSNYPVYVKWINLSILHYCDIILHLYKALEEDESAIRVTFGIQEPLAPSMVNFNLGDSHRGGKTVLMLEYPDGEKLIYKPRNISIDEHFTQLLNYCQNSTDFLFRTPQMVVSKDHGWVEFMNYQECANVTDIKEYYYRLGGLLAILYSLNATDFHYENIICCGAFPVLIDLESFFVPYIPVEVAETSKSLLGSVLSTGMLPTTIVLDKEEKPEDKYTLEISGVVDVEGKDAITEETQFIIDENGNVSVTRIRGKMKGANNIPIYGSKKIQAEEYSCDIVEGFEKMYSFIVTNKQSYIEQIEMFRNDVVRIVLRNTVVYSYLLREANNVNILKDETELKDLFSKWLGQAIPDFRFLEKVVSHEIDDLTNLDIPLFTTKVDSKNLWYGDELYIEDCFEETGFNRALRKIARMDSNDCERQKWLIETSLNYERKSMFDDYSSSVLPNDYSDTADTNEKLKIIASSVFQYIKNHILETEDSVSWLTVNAGNYSNSRIQIFGSSYDLFSGMPGEILFLANYDKVFGCHLAKHLAIKAYNTLKDTIERMLGSITLLGLYKGWGSILFLNTSLFRITGDDYYLQTNRKYFEIIDFYQLIEKDHSFGVIKGCAGFILSCIDYFKVSNCKNALDAAVIAADYLLDKACHDVNVGMGWRITSRQPLSGYSHGSSGFALAFLRLYEQTNDIKYFNAISKIIDYEDSTYDDLFKNWKDLRDHVIRENNEPPFLAAWAHGSGGIGLTRLEMIKSGLFNTDPRIKHDLDIALETTLSRGFTNNFSLTVGTFGNIELLLNYLEQFDDPRILTQYMSLINSIYNAYSENDYHICFPIKSLGLMAGVTGIGYECLRLLKPNIVPSVLIL